MNDHLFIAGERLTGIKEKVFYFTFTKIFIDHSQIHDSTIIYKDENKNEVLPEASLMPFIIAN